MNHWNHCKSVHKHQQTNAVKIVSCYVNRNTEHLEHSHCYQQGNNIQLNGMKFNLIFIISLHKKMCLKLQRNPIKTTLPNMFEM